MFPRKTHKFVICGNINRPKHPPSCRVTSSFPTFVSSPLHPFLAFSPPPRPRLLPEFEIPEVASQGLLRSACWIKTIVLSPETPAGTQPDQALFAVSAVPRPGQICEIRTDTATPITRYRDRAEPLGSARLGSPLRCIAADLLKMAWSL